MDQKHLAPDDDPNFAAWIRDVGPQLGLEPERGRGSAVVAGIALIAAVIGMGTACGIALALAMAAVSAVMALLLGAIGIVTALIAVAYLVVKAT